MRIGAVVLVASLVGGVSAGCSAGAGANADGAAVSDAGSRPIDSGGEPPVPPSDASASDGASDAPRAEAPVVAIAPFSDEVWTWDETIDSCGYSNHGNPFWDWILVGREPVDPGAYPVFIYLHGTGDVADSPVAVHVVERMARRGYVAASVPYDSLGGIGAILGDATRACGLGAKKAECLFGAGIGSAITRLCARSKAACGRGIVLAGHSQGSWLATLAKNHDARVRAVYGVAEGIHEHIAVNLGPTTLNIDSDLSTCMPAGKRALPADRLRVVDGESEYLYGTALQRDVRDLTGLDCPAGTLECLRPNGSGWTFFPDAANEDGRAKSQHCYMANMPAGDCTASTGFNSHWSEGAASYALEPSLAWLRSFTD